MSVKTVQGDLVEMALDGEFDCIAHGCNCFNNWGAGIAKQFKVAFPNAHRADVEDTKKGDEFKLGKCSVAKEACRVSGRNVHVFNLYTQYGYGKHGIKSHSLRYPEYNGDGKDIPHALNEDIRSCFYSMARFILTRFNRPLDTTIGLPKIGAGHGGGDWIAIRDIIEEELGIFDVTIVEYCNGM